MTSFQRFDVVTTSIQRRVLTVFLSGGAKGARAPSLNILMLEIGKILVQNWGKIGKPL